MTTRRTILQAGVIAQAGVLAPLALRSNSAKAIAPIAPPLDPLSQPQFVNPLPIPPVIDATRGAVLDLRVTQFRTSLGIVDPVTRAPLQSTVWGYNGCVPGPTIVARSGVPTYVQWSNGLVDALGTPLQHLLPVDPTMHWADPLRSGSVAGRYTGPVPLVTHLHGANVGPESDGHPEAWFTPGYQHTGRMFNQIYTYPNNQEATTLWYHDHTIGITRLNVYAGLAGNYWLRDANEDALVAARRLPSGRYEVPLIIQDRLFLADGSIHYPTDPEVAGQPDPSWLPEFFGDIVTVNGAAWPVLEVEPRQYRLRMVNASDSRFYSMTLSSRQPFFQIGCDQGLLNSPVELQRLILGPGERADVVLDFADFRGATIVLRNDANSPFPGGDPVDSRTAGRVMAFRVSRPLDARVPRTQLPGNLRPVLGPIRRLVQNGPTRKLLLFEGMDSYGRLLGMLGTAAGGGLMWEQPATEIVRLGDTEVWEVYNSSADAHPIHLHLVNMQVLNRQAFTATQEPTMGALSNIRLVGRARAPAPNEAGAKDTVNMYPGEVTRIIAKFIRPGEYVWHCHILSHEDHEMMRPLIIQ